MQPDWQPHHRKKLDFIWNNYTDAAAEAAAVQKDSGSKIDVSALAVVFLQWGAWESGYGVNPRDAAQNNFFGAQVGASGSIPCSQTVLAITGPTTNACFPAGESFLDELTLALSGVPHTATNPNPNGYSYESYLLGALAVPQGSPASWLQSIAKAGWNGSTSYGSAITGGITRFPAEINCLQKNGYI